MDHRHRQGKAQLGGGYSFLFKIVETPGGGSGGCPAGHPPPPPAGGYPRPLWVRPNVDFVLGPIFGQKIFGPLFIRLGLRGNYGPP